MAGTNRTKKKKKNIRCSHQRDNLNSGTEERARPSLFQKDATSRVFTKVSAETMGACVAGEGGRGSARGCLPSEPRPITGSLTSTPAAADGTPVTVHEPPGLKRSPTKRSTVVLAARKEGFDPPLSAHFSRCMRGHTERSSSCSLAFWGL